MCVVVPYVLPWFRQGVQYEQGMGLSIIPTFDSSVRSVPSNVIHPMIYYKIL